MFRKFGVNKNKSGGYKKLRIRAKTMDLGNWYYGKLDLHCILFLEARCSFLFN